MQITNILLHCVLLFTLGEMVTSHGSIEPDKDNIREEPYSLPPGFTWDALDLGNAAVVSRLLYNPSTPECPKTI